MPTAPRTLHRARHLTALKAAAARREAIAAARRTHLGEVRAAVRTQIEESYRQRQELAGALLRLRRGLMQFRARLRARLHAAGAAEATGSQAAHGGDPSELRSGDRSHVQKGERSDGTAG